MKTTTFALPRLLLAPIPALFPALFPALALALFSAPALAQSSTQLTPVVVTATRIDTAPFDVPASIDLIGGDSIRSGRAQVNISESLGPVPGLLARDRQNYAQDVQISVRGFGARSSFGIRGVRLYVDGIPATLPDGQGQITNVDLGSADRIEVLRGPFSALYGNSSGGVIQVFSEEGAGPPTLGFGVSGGSDGALRLGAKFSGAAGSFGFVASTSRFTTDGYREHSATERTLGNVKLTLAPDTDSQFTLVANSLSLPKAQDPLGLTRAQFETNPRSVDASATNFDTRKTVDQLQGGLIYERRINANNSVRALVYSGHRSTEQFQSIPVATQANPLHPGGVISLARNYSGTDLRWTLKGAAAQMPATLVAGLAYDKLNEHRVGLQNFVGTTLGVEGALRRDENNVVSNFDQYLQATLQVLPSLSVNAGVRHSQVKFASTDHYIVGTNPDDSGSVQYSATLPVLGVLFALSPELHVYATAGRGFETPTLNELAYRPGGATGLNLGLQAARSTSAEVGIKARPAGLGELTVAVFETHTSNEIATLSNLGGRATFQNVGATKRQGIELGWSATLAEKLRAQAAATWLDARYRSGFSTCAGAPCATPTQAVAAGNQLPGIANTALFAALSWAPALGWRGGVEGRYLSRVYVNDANADSASGHFIASANVGYGVRVGAWELSGFARADNLFDRAYIGSVIVNEGNSRFFEPAPGRTWTAGVSAAYTF
jgi:iron complex outermembrane recepter protein